MSFLFRFKVSSALSGVVPPGEDGQAEAEAEAEAESEADSEAESEAEAEAEKDGKKGYKLVEEE